MRREIEKQRLYALLLAAGASILLFRTASMMFFEDAFLLLVLWVILLLILEFVIDLGCVIFSVRWFISSRKEQARIPLRLGAAATILHAVRVAVFVLGRTGPWENFDIKSEHHSTYTFEWFWVYFAAVLSLLGVVGVVVIWQVIRKRKKNHLRSNL